MRQKREQRYGPGGATAEFEAVPDFRPDDNDDDHCPECGAPIIAQWSGVKCSECAWWFCY